MPPARGRLESRQELNRVRLSQGRTQLLKWGVAQEGARWSITSGDEMLGKRNLPRSISSHNAAVGMMPGRSTGISLIK